MAKKQSVLSTWVIFLIVGVLGLGIGALIGYFSRVKRQGDGPCLGNGVPHKIIAEADSNIRQKIFEGINAKNIRNYVREYTKYTHVAGTPGDEKLAEQLYRTWKEQGLDHVTKSTYDVLLSHPDEEDPNWVKVEDNIGNTIIDSRLTEQNGVSDQVKHFPSFNAYSKAGDFEGELVFINYGLKSDLDYIENNASIDLTDKILLCKLGKVFWGALAHTVHKKGARGILFFPEPSDFSSATDDRVYPDSWWMPPSGLVSGSLFTGDGDPLTPGYPSLDSAYRWKEEDLQTLPKIPAHPIGYGDAEKIMRLMQGSTAPDKWKGRLNATYRIGPGFQNSELSLKLHIATKNKRVNSSNIFGYITGSVEPDRYVLMGNHRDAWSVGAVDPTGGTGIMMEISRVLAQLVKQGWRPRRTIVFCSWGAEEYGIIGSFEWVEEHVKILHSRAVAYLNMDMVVQGNFSIRGGSGPMLTETLFTVAKTIKSPNNPETNLYEEWVKSFPKKDKNGTKLNEPQIWRPSTGSDYSAFVVLAGVPSMHVSYSTNPNVSSWGFPLYHTKYDTFHALDNYVDRGFKCSQTMGKYFGEMLRYLSDSLVLPLRVQSYNEVLEEHIANLKTGYAETFKNHSITLDYLEEALAEFISATNSFESHREKINTNNPIEVRMYNDQIMMLERAFQDSSGNPYNSHYKNLLFGPSGAKSKGGSTFPGLVNLVSKTEDVEDPSQQWEDVKKHLAIVTFIIHAAADAMTSSLSNSFEI